MCSTALTTHYSGPERALRAGGKLPPERREILEQAKEELRTLHGKARRRTRQYRRRARQLNAPGKPESQDGSWS